MITLKSDYSPSAAPEKQEDDNIKMLEMLLYVAGLSPVEIQNYNDDSDLSAKMYVEALGEPTLHDEVTDTMVHTQEQWDAAVKAAAGPLAVMRDMLAAKGLTINNILIPSDDPGYFSWVKTTVYKGGADMVEVAQIERPITDIEAETYKNNLTGYAAVNPECVPVEPEPVDDNAEEVDDDPDCQLYDAPVH